MGTVEGRICGGKTVRGRTLRKELLGVGTLGEGMGGGEGDYGGGVRGRTSWEGLWGRRLGWEVRDLCGP